MRFQWGLTPQFSRVIDRCKNIITLRYEFAKLQIACNLAAERVGSEQEVSVTLHSALKASCLNFE